MRIGNIIIDNSWIIEANYMIGGQSVPEYQIYNSADIYDVTGWQARSFTFKIVLYSQNIPAGQTVQTILDTFNDLKVSGVSFNFKYSDRIYGTFVLEQNGVSADIKRIDSNDNIFFCELFLKIKETSSLPVIVSPTTTDVTVTSLNEDILKNQVLRDKNASDIGSFRDKFNQGVQSFQTFQMRAQDSISEMKENVENLQGYLVQAQNLVTDVQGAYENAQKVSDSLTNMYQAIASGDPNIINTAFVVFSETNNALDISMIEVNRYSYLRL